jgi:mRNA-degrading endonuclease RelE of RelBE toxin-antitoxin system
VTSPGESWRISKIANEARRAIESLDLETQEKILTELEGLQADPFMGNVKKIKGKLDIFRLRSGRFRIYFRINAASRLIEILLFDRRSAIKDKNVQRL